MKSFYLFFTILSICLFSINELHAQCDPTNEVESWYSWAKDWENFALDFWPMTDAEETIMGDKLAKQMAKENTIVENHPNQASLDNIIARLKKGAKRKDLNYQVHIMEDDQTLNAFSIAGGHIYITTKMISWVESEDELAFILAHEIGHIDENHAQRKAQKLEIGDYYLGEEYGSTAATLEMLLTAPIGQIDEYEADRAGARLAAKAGFDPRKGLDFFTRMAQYEQYDYVQKVLRTHPYSHERHGCLDHYMSQELKQ